MKDYYDPGYYGTEHHWRHPVWGILYADSVRDFCTQHECYWLLDVIAGFKLEKEEFYVITVDVENSKGTITVQTDSGMPPVARQKISFTDLKVSIRLYWEAGVLIFPSDR